MTHAQASHHAPAAQTDHPSGFAGDTAVRTSLSHPLRIDEVAAGRAGGRIGISLCPGKRASSLLGPRWERDLSTDIDVIRRWRPDAVVTLIEDHEFIELNVVNLGAQVRAQGIAWHHLPIVDVHPPDARFETGWQVSGPELVACLIAGGRVLVHCRGGLGRAGTVAARMLIEMDMPARDAVARVRQARPGAIETSDQLNYVLRLHSACRA